MVFLRRLAAALIVAFALCNSSTAQVRRTQNHSLPSSGIAGEAQIRDRLNAWTIGLAGGLLEGAPIHFATEIARVASEGGMVHVLPIVTRGPTENVNDLLYLKGIDAAIINSDSLEEYKSQVPQIQQRINYILNLFPSELHIFVRPEIRSLADLAGKKVNFNTQGTAAAYSGPLIFSRLGLAVEKNFIPHPIALEQMRRGEIAGVVFVTSKPVDAFVKGKWEEGFKFLPVEYGPKFADYYLPSYLEATDYPGLVVKGERIATIAVPTLLAAFNWRPGSDRYRRVARFVDELFSRVDRLQSPGFDPKWRDVNITTPAPGLERFRAAQEWLDRANAAKQGGHP
ncbi:TAXI family TRAP transporter solute-binding subunit [Bradyrhizobium sp. 76]|uniref:TAXI family TRAP transporter solute-binding subunit n=1 Tax=Bradyrhizobium sp. 76 TaxID=2782680 RepID=UPI001FFA3DC5|nr:TAXI family TRAP transporter solute-binding subunit [Bradyrhizobium sp. 76]MCK1407697.1 C4-dicarboxylate ABC transporter substrate-binding protein [Bradyrhizobium sp. 76]